MNFMLLNCIATLYEFWPYLNFLLEQQIQFVLTYLLASSFRQNRVPTLGQFTLQFHCFCLETCCAVLCCALCVCVCVCDLTLFFFL